MMDIFFEYLFGIVRYTKKTISELSIFGRIMSILIVIFELIIIWDIAMNLSEDEVNTYKIILLIFVFLLFTTIHMIINKFCKIKRK